MLMSIVERVNMWRSGARLRLLWLVVAWLSLYGACGWAISPELAKLLTEDEQKWLSTHAELRIGVDPDNAPIEWNDENGRHAGMAADYMALIRDRLGIRTHLVQGLTSGQVLESIKTRTIDLLPAPIRTEDREAYIAFTEPISDMSTVIITRSDRQDIRSMEDLAGRRVSVVRDWAYAEWLMKNPSIAASKRDDIGAALEAVAFGEVEAYFGDMVSAAAAIDRAGLGNLKVAGYGPYTAHVCIGVRQDWPELVAILNKTLSTIGPQERAAIRDRWIRLNSHTSLREIMSILVPALILAVILTLLIVNRRLCREVRSRLAMERRAKEELALRMEREAMLIQQSRMAAMGEMIGAIAHQWRQPLNMVGATIQDIKDAHEHHELDQAYLDRTVAAAMNQIQFMSKTIDDFRNFLRVDKEKTLFDIQQVADEVLAMLAPQLAAVDVSCRLALREGEAGLRDVDGTTTGSADLRVKGFENEMKQVFLNLIVNAKEAILERRERSGTGVPKHGVVIVDFAREADHVVVRVTDNGGGIPDHLLDRVFEPYFTTKDRSLGTGIGLYMSKMIVENNIGGRLTVRNVSGGSEFRIEV